MIAKNLLHSSGIFTIKSFANIGLFFIAAKLIGLEAVGQLAIGVAIFVLFEQIFDFGAKLVVLKEVPQVGVDANLINKLKLSKFVLLFLVGLPAILYLGNASGFAIMIFAAFLSSFSILFKAIFQAKNNFQFELRSNLMRTLCIYFGLYLCLIYADTNLVFSGFLVGAALELYYFVWLNRAKLGFRKFHFNITFTDILGELSRSFPYAAHSIISVSYATFDIFIISALTSDEIVGTYQMVMKLLFGGLIVGSVLSQAIYPKISYSRAGHDFIRTCFRWLAIYAVLGLMIGLSCFFFGQIFLQFFDINLTNSTFIILALSFIIFLRYLTIVPGIVLTVSGAQSRRVIVLVIITILSISSNYILVPLYGIDGAFMTLALGTLMSGSLYMIFLRQVIKQLEV
jgi:O-antigen/teichoic acid export membrane protein